jgi:hypothetical protein
VSLTAEVQEHGGEVAWRQALFFNVEHAEKPVLRSELVFVNVLRRPRIDSKPGRPVGQPYLSYLPARLHRLAESIPEKYFYQCFRGKRDGDD